MKTFPSPLLGVLVAVQAFALTASSVQAAYAYAHATSSGGSFTDEGSDDAEAASTGALGEASAEVSLASGTLRAHALTTYRYQHANGQTLAFDAFTIQGLPFGTEVNVPVQLRVTGAMDAGLSVFGELSSALLMAGHHHADAAEWSMDVSLQLTSYDADPLPVHIDEVVTHTYRMTAGVPFGITYSLTASANGVGSADFSSTGVLSFGLPAGASVSSSAGFLQSSPEPSTYTVAFVAGPNGTLTGVTSQTVAHGGDCTPVTAQAAYGFVFVEWDDHVTTATRTVTNVTADQTFTASFRAASALPPPWNDTFLAVTDSDGVRAGRGLWDLSGSYVLSVAGNPLAMDLVHGTKGKLTGMATYTVAKATVVSTAIKGSVKGTAGDTVVAIALKGADPTKAVSVALTLHLAVNASTRELTGLMTGSVTSGGVTTRVDDELVLPIPAPMDGTWTLRLSLAPGAKGVTGTGLLTLANGVDYASLVKGKLAGTTAVLALAGDPADPGAKGIRIKATVTPLEGGWARLERFSGRAYGQTVGW